MREETCPHCGKRGGQELWTGFDSLQRPLALGRMSLAWTESAYGVSPSVLCSTEVRLIIDSQITHWFSVCRSCGGVVV